MIRCLHRVRLASIKSRFVTLLMKECRKIVQDYQPVNFSYLVIDLKPFCTFNQVEQLAKIQYLLSLRKSTFNQTEEFVSKCHSRYTLQCSEVSKPLIYMRQPSTQSNHESSGHNDKLLPRSVNSTFNFICLTKIRPQTRLGKELFAIGRNPSLLFSTPTKVLSNKVKKNPF